MRGLLESFSTDASGAKFRSISLRRSRQGCRSRRNPQRREWTSGAQRICRRQTARGLGGARCGRDALSRESGVARSSLNRWQHTGDIIGLLKGTHKHVYPIDQFVDSRPARGIAEVNAVVSNPRVAWLWLSRGNPTLGGQRPIDLLKHDRVAEVVEAARAYFQQG